MLTVADYEPCFDCERPVRTDRPHWRRHYTEPLPGGQVNDLGWFAVGPECRRDHPEAKRFDGLG